MISTALNTMRQTDHCQLRMKQRGVTEDLLALVMSHGTENPKGDAICLGRNDLDQFLKEMRRMITKFEKLKAKGGASIIFKEKNIVTTYFHTKGFIKNE